MEIQSLILMRTPVFESLLPDEERGVNVSLEGRLDDGFILTSLTIQENIVEIVDTKYSYRLDVSRVDDDDINDMKRIAKKLNFDSRFHLKIQ